MYTVYILSALSAIARSIGAGAWLAEHEVEGSIVMAQHQDWSIRTKVSIGENVGVSPAPSEQHGNTVSPGVSWEHHCHMLAPVTPSLPKVAAQCAATMGSSQ